MESVFIELAILLAIAFAISYIARAFKQPIIIGYILAGILISPFIIKFGASTELIEIFSKFGIALLLFIVGLHLNPKIVKEIGVSSLLIGVFQIIITFIAGFLISTTLFGFNVLTSLYIGIAISFSSTIIIMKLLSDKRQIDSLYGKISIGILIVQDLVAAAVIMFISSFSNGVSFGSVALKSFYQGGLLILFLFLFGYLFLSRITNSIAKSQELLFLFSICWCFIVSALFSYFGLSIEIGALIAGMILSISPYSIEISSKIRPLRDFFIIIFFIIVGLNINFFEIKSILASAVILSLAVLILKPLILLSFMALFRFTKRTNFLVGVTLAQISEFSLIILALGFSMGHVSQEILSIVTLTGIITITVSTYMIIYSNALYSKLYKFISFFERKNAKKEKEIRKKYDAFLFGYNRIGFNILSSLKKIKKNYLVVDFNPDTIKNLSKFKVPCIYGDAYDIEFLDELPIDSVELVVSTIPDFEINFLLIEYVKSVNPKAIIIVRAHQIKEALDLYKKGADYVLTPHFLGGEYIAKMIREVKSNSDKYKEERKKHISSLNRIWDNYKNLDLEKS